jgi:hypothetical protein
MFWQVWAITRYVPCGAGSTSSHAPFGVLGHKITNDTKCSAFCRMRHNRHTYSTLLRSVGTDFRVQGVRHSSLRSTLDVYTQAVTPAKHAAQAAVMSLVFSSDKHGGGTRRWIGSCGR